MKGKQQDFRTEKYIRYGIRKYSFGAASVAIAAGLMFLGNGVVSATEVQAAEAPVAATAPAEKTDQDTAEAKPETTKAEEVKPEVKAEEAKKVNKAILEASIATLESKLSTAKYADATVVNSAKEVLAAAKATLAKADASQADVDAQAETVSALSTVVTESNTAGFDKKQAAEKEVAKAEAEKKATPAEKTLSEAKSGLDKASSEADVTNRLAKSELSKKEVKEENKAAVEAAVAKNKAVLAETKALLAEKSVTKEQVDAQLERLNESILAVYNELKNAGIGRDGKFAVNLEDAQTTALKDSSTEAGQKWLADHGYSSLADIPILNKGKDDKEIKEASKQIQWLDFTDTAAWSNLDADGQLQIGSAFRKELMPGYVVTLTVKEMKPFHATETYKNRVAGTASEDTYNPDAVNSFKKATGIGGSAQTKWAHVKNAGFDTASHKTTIAGTDDKSKQQNGTIGGVVFSVDAEYNGKKTKPTILMTSGEDIKVNESEIYTTNGTPWDLYALVGNASETTPYQPNAKMRNVTSPQEFRPADDKLQKALANGAFSTPDTATSGLGSQVFGSYINGEGGNKATPIVSTAGATEVGFYIISGGAQSSMIGISLSDFGDLPESYGKAEHSLRSTTTDYATNQTEEIQQPYLGKVKADPEAKNGERVRGIGSDDATDNADEGVAQLIAPENVHTNKDNGEPEVKLVQGADNTYRVKVIASANGNDKYTGTVEPAYVRGFIDFNNNGKFDEGEASDIVKVTGNNETVELVFRNTQVVDTTKDKVNFRTRIAKSEKQVTKATGIAFSGEVEDNQIQVALPPRGDKEETTGKQGETQSVGIEFVSHALGDDASNLGSNNGKTTFNSYGKLDYSEQANSISAETTKKKQPQGVMIVDPQGNLVKSYTKAGQGTYTVIEDKVIFTPEANFVGKADGIVLRAVDANGQSTGWTALTDQNQLENINDGTHTTTTKTMDAVYIPTVTPKEITADPETSTDVQGKAQKKTPTFTAGAGTENPTPVTPSAQYPAKLVDPKTGDKVDSVTVEGQGTYTINPTTGEVTFQPLPNFTGTATGVGVSLTAPVGQDKDGNPVTATATTTYTPTVTAVTPTADPATSTGVQGETQKGTPTFTEGNTEVPIKENSHKLLDKEGNEVPAGQTTPAYAEDGVTPVGTYSIDPATGEVTFTPTDKSYTGKVTPVKVQAEDKNGTKVSTTYTPNIIGVTPTATPDESTGVQGETQEGTVSFAPGETTIGGEKKSVPIKANSAVLLDASGNPVAPGTPVDALDPQGNKVGEYTIDPATNKVTFTPTDKTYVGQVQPAKVQAEDENGTKVSTTYTPTIVGVTPTATPATTEDVQGKTQESTVSFEAGKTTVDGVEKSVEIDPATYTLLGEDGQPAKEVPAKDPEGNVIGKYTLKTVDGKAVAVFEPTDKTYSGEVQPVRVQAKDKNGTAVETTYTPKITPVTPTAEPAKSEAIQGDVQKGTPTFAPGDTIAPIKENSYKLLDKEGNEVPAGQTTPAYAEDGVTPVGTYSIDPATGEVTFTPTDKSYTGKVTPANVQAEDTNGTKVSTTYTPSIIPAQPTAEPVKTVDVQGATQTGKPVFQGGTAMVNGEEKTVEIDDTVPAKLVDPKTGDKVDSLTVEGEGTYTVAPDGTVTFKPEKNFTGVAKGVEVVRQDKNGTPAKATYTPEVKPVTPTGTDAVTEDIQGSTQTGKPTFEGGKVTVNGEEKTVEIDEDKPAKLVDPKTGDPVDSVTIEGEGTYTVAPDGTVTFTPEKTFTGKGTGVTVRREDKNGTPVTAKYTPVVKPATPTAEPAKTVDVQGATQTGKPVFTPGKTTVNGEEKTVELSDKPAKLVDPKTGDPVDSVTIEGEGTYTVTPDGTVTFTPEKNFTGKGTGVTVQREDKNGTPVKATYTPEVKPVTPTGTDAVTEDVQGSTQTGKPVFTPGKTTVNGEEKTVELSDKPAKLVDPKTGDPVDSVTIEGEGTYTVAPDGTVTFTPEKNFTGKGTGVTVQREDKNGTPVTAKYTPVVKPATPTSSDVITTNVQGATQEGTPTFEGGKVTVNGEEKTVEIDEDKPAKLVDPKTGDPVDSVTIEGEGTYTVAPDGTVTFTPEKTFTGKGTGVTVRREDKNGTPVTAKYTPVVKPATPTAEPAKTVDVQGATQTGKPVFTPGKTTVNGEEKTVELSDKPAKLVDPKTGDPVDSVTIEGEGTYTVTPDGTVTFTPEKNFTGKGTGVTVQREDKNGTPVKATYTPEVKPVTPTGTDAVTEDVQGSTQTGKPVFTPGKTTVNGEEKTVELSDKPAKLVDPKTGDPVDSVTIEGEGTYTVAPDGTVTFTPEKNFTGKGTGVTVQREDKNGTPVTAKYTPVVKPATPTSSDVITTNVQGATQEGTPTFEGGKVTVNGEEKTVEIDETVKPTLEGADEEGKVVVPGEGTYTIDENGKVTFTPEKTFTGQAKGVTVKRVDKNGTPVTAKYTPVVVPVTPTSKDTESEGPKGQPQSGTPTFEGGKVTINGKEVPVEIDEAIKPTFDDGKTEKKVPGEGTYTIDENGKVTFTPEPDFVGKASGVTVQRVDKNGTPVTAKYTPTVRPDTSFVDKDGNPLSPREDGTKPSKDIPGYKIVKTEVDEKGNTKHIYEKVKTSFKDKEGNEIPGNPSEDGEQPKKDIPGYRFVETKKLPNGDTEHVYEKVSTPLIPQTEPYNPTPTPVTEKVLTTYVDENGELIIPDENGSHPGKSLEGYELVRTEKDANGNVRNVYRKIQSQKPVQPVEPATPAMPEQPAKPQVPATPAQPVQPTAVKEAEGKRELPNTGTEDNARLAALGLLGVLSGFGLVARKKKED